MAVLEQGLANFLKQDWRKRHRFFTGACKSSLASLQITRNQYLQLVKQEHVESRLVRTPDYDLTLGPMNLDTVPGKHLLMIQGLEQQFEEVNQLVLQDFKFLPRWRIDDVMATIGDMGANCGPHFDHYDVFLVQVSGSKTWQLDSGGHQDSALQQDAAIRLLPDFSASTTLVAKPGDVLYVPPRMGHWGIASDDSVTLSVGIRNPTLTELISHLADSIIESMDDPDTLDDGLQNQQFGLSQSDISNLQSKLGDALLNPGLLADWYGCYLTELREPEILSLEQTLSTAEITVKLNNSKNVRCTLPSRLTFFNQTGNLTLYINGEALDCEPSVLPWFKTLAGERLVATKEIEPNNSNIELLQYLYRVDAIQFSETALSP